MVYHWMDPDNLLLSLIITVTVQISFFIIAVIVRNFGKARVIRDFAVGSNFLILAILTLIISGDCGERQIIVSICTCLWAMRLVTFILYRNSKLGKDNETDAGENPWRNLMLFWILQTLWIFIVSLPVIFINSVSGSNPSGSEYPQLIDLLGFALFIMGLGYETVADFQKTFYKEDPENKERWCDVGLWRYCRHPNYFGEVICWWGIFFMGLPGYQGLGYVSILSPIITMGAVILTSGLGKSWDQYGRDPSYREYKRVTSPIIPLPRKFYGRLSPILKMFLFFEFQNRRIQEEAVGIPIPMTIN